MKADNPPSPAKLALRRHFLKRYHADTPIHVFDCCQGSARIWTTLQSEFTLASYWGVDVKAKAGRIQIDSRKILDQPGLNANVIDIDTYGSPWKHWLALLRNCAHSVTVFLTAGERANLGCDKTILFAMGLGSIEVPKGIGSKLLKLSLPFCIGLADNYGFEITETVEAEQSGAGRCLGVRLKKVKVVA
jgi:hypothetical protein